MPDDERPDLEFLTPTRSPFPLIEGERRKEDRRQSGRQGKYDRRKNRCQHCVHFSEADAAGVGTCLFHKHSIDAQAFACPNFEPLQGGS